jgi:predicted nucleotidyltransferase
VKDRIVREFTKAVSSRVGAHIKNIIFFGSRVKNTYKPYSDYDFLIVLDHKETNIINEIYEEALDFLLRFGVDISLKIYSEKDYTKRLSMGTPFMQEIKKHGEIVWSRK